MRDAEFWLAPGTRTLDLCPQTQWAHGGHHRPCAPTASPRVATKCRYLLLSSVHRRVTPWRELTRHCSLRPGGASLLAQTLRSEQGGDRSRAQWSRLAPPPPLFHLTHGLRRRALGCSRQGEGCTIELDSSSLAPGVGPLHPATTPTGREEPGTSLYPSYNDPPDAPRPRQCQGGDFGRLQQAGIAGSGRIWASQLALQPAWAGPSRGGHCGGRGGSRGMKTGVSERSRNSCS